MTTKKVDVTKTVTAPPSAVSDAVAADAAMKEADAYIKQNMQVEALDLEGPGYIKRWRDVIGFKDAFMEIEKASVERIDEATVFLIDHIVEPKEAGVKRAILDELDLSQLIALFNAIMGVDAVPPASGGA